MFAAPGWVRAVLSKPERSPLGAMQHVTILSVGRVGIGRLVHDGQRRAVVSDAYVDQGAIHVVQNTGLSCPFHSFIPYRVQAGARAQQRIHAITITGEAVIR